MVKKTVKDLNLKGKKVLVRADFNVPMEAGKITNDNRIQAAIPNLEYILKEGGKVIVFSHLGRIKTEEDKKGNSLKVVSERLSELLEKKVEFINKTRGEELENAIDSLKEGEILMFENTRFEDLNGKKESNNDPKLGKYWASLGDVFVNDAFGTAHRSHASNQGIAKNLDSAVGFLVQKEIDFIGGAVDYPKDPFVVILGGAKVSDKIGVIENLLERADKILIGGGMAYTFFKAQGREVGKSLLEEDKIDLAKSIIEKAGDKLILPVDTVVGKEFDNNTETRIVEGDFPEDFEGLDIGPKTINLFKEELKDAKTVVWNGPMGVFEMPNFSVGTKELSKILANLDSATTIIGGGDSARAIHQLGFEKDFSHISTGGGASLEYLKGKELPGIQSISDK